MRAYDLAMVSLCRGVRFGFAVTLASLLASIVTLPLHAEVFVVDAFGLRGDADPGDGICRTADGDCTLQAALAEVDFSEDPLSLSMREEEDDAENGEA